MQHLYQVRFSEKARKAKAGVWKVLAQDYFQRWIQPSDIVLDLGCGFGEFLNHIQCARRIGIDLNPENQKFLLPGIEFHAGNVSRLDPVPDRSVDLVFTSNLMEHLPDKREVEQMLGEIWRVLKPNGHLMAMGPNLRFLGGKYWDFWDHHVPLTDHSLTEILEVLGFRVVGCTPRFLPYTTRSSIPQVPWLVKSYLRLSWVWPLLGRQFLIRARKPGD